MVAENTTVAGVTKPMDCTSHTNTPAAPQSASAAQFRLYWCVLFDTMTQWDGGVDSVNVTTAVGAAFSTTSYCAAAARSAAVMPADDSAVEVPNVRSINRGVAATTATTSDSTEQ